MIISNVQNQPKIAIIGGGPGGLCLANILLKNNIPFEVFESDRSPHERNQGGSLDIHPAHGQKALREAGLWDAFIEHARPEADVMKVVNQRTGEVTWDGNTTDKMEVPEEDKYGSRPEIDREALQNILLAPLMEKNGVMIWGKRLREVVPAGNEQYDLHFTDGTMLLGYDLVVGADGAWSHTRRLLSDTMPYYSGIALIELWVKLSEMKEEDRTWFESYLGAGSCFSFDEGRSVLSQRLGQGCARTYACVRKPETFMKDSGIDWEDPDMAREQYLNMYFDDCCDDLQRLMHLSTTKLVPRMLYMLPVGFSWESRPGVTLVGDAAHLMTPFAGVGVNSALSDAYDLGRKIVDFVDASTNGSKQGIGEMTAAYDRDLFPRGEMFAQKTYKGLIGHFAADGNDEFVSRLHANKAEREEKWAKSS